MNAFNNVIRTVNALTGRNARRGRALRSVSAWAITLQRFLTDFNLYGTNNLGTLLENPGNAKFDLVSITHNGRQVAEHAKAFKGTGMPDLVLVIVNGAENIRRYLINPGLQAKPLSQAVRDLRIDYEKLQATLKRIENPE